MPKHKKQYSRTNIGKSVVAIGYVAMRTYRINEFYNEIDDHNAIILRILPDANGIDLTHYTEEELDIVKKIINDAIEMARPTCQELDRRTEVALAENDIRNRRLWRAKPRYVELPRKGTANADDDNGLPVNPDGQGDEQQYDPSVPSRP